MPSNSWTILYDDGENIQQASATGKISLDANWVFILDTSVVPNPVIVLAVPQHRVIDVRIDD